MSTHCYTSSLHRELGLRLVLTRYWGQPFIPYVWAQPGHPRTNTGHTFLIGATRVFTYAIGTTRATFGTSVFRWQGMLLGKFTGHACCVYRVPRLELVGGNQRQAKDKE